MLKLYPKTIRTNLFRLLKIAYYFKDNKPSGTPSFLLVKYFEGFENYCIAIFFWIFFQMNGLTCFYWNSIKIVLYVILSIFN